MGKKKTKRRALSLVVPFGGGQPLFRLVLSPGIRIDGGPPGVEVPVSEAPVPEVAMTPPAPGRVPLFSDPTVDPSRATAEDMLRQLQTQLSIERIWPVIARPGCCPNHGPMRSDGVFVVVPAGRVVALGRARGASPDFNPIIVYTFDGHQPAAPLFNGALMDKEDIKRLINHLSEAVAYVEGRVIS